jgi:hypothetical protein
LTPTFPAVGNKGRALGLLKVKTKPRKAPAKRKRHELGMVWGEQEEPALEQEPKRLKPNPQ